MVTGFVGKPKEWDIAHPGRCACLPYHCLWTQSVELLALTRLWWFVPDPTLEKGQELRKK